MSYRPRMRTKRCVGTRRRPPQDHTQLVQKLTAPRLGALLTATIGNGLNGRLVVSCEGDDLIQDVIKAILEQLPETMDPMVRISFQCHPVFACEVIAIEAFDMNRATKHSCLIETAQFKRRSFETGPVIHPSFRPRNGSLDDWPSRNAAAPPASPGRHGIRRRQPVGSARCDCGGVVMCNTSGFSVVSNVANVAVPARDRVPRCQLLRHDGFQVADCALLYLLNLSTCASAILPHPTIAIFKPTQRSFLSTEHGTQTASIPWLHGEWLLCGSSNCRRPILNRTGLGAPRAGPLPTPRVPALEERSQIEGRQ